MSKIELPELEKYLWDSAVILRGSMGAGSYKNYIFPLLFYKRICDVYDEQYAELMRETGDEDYASNPLNYRFDIPKEAHWNVIRELTADVGQGISDALKKIENANRNLLGIFGDAKWTNKNRLPDSLLKELIEHISSKTLSNENCSEDELGQGYEYLIGKFADDSGHTAQEFYTNRTIVHLMTELLKPQPEDTIYDPTCGSGGMLISSIAYLKDHDLEWRSVRLFGQEISPLTASIGKMNLFMHGVAEVQIAQGDTLQYPAFIENGKLKTFDVVLANPPYSIKEWNRSLFEHDPYGRNFLGTPPQGRADYAFFQHILKSMDPKKGRCAILFPHGVLFRQEEKDLREKLVKMDVIECVIGVAQGLFYNSPMEACVVICNYDKPAHLRHKIKFIDAKNEFFKDGSYSALSPSHIKKISEAFDSKEEVPGFSSIVDIDQIVKNNSFLSLSTNIEVEECSDNPTVSVLMENWANSFDSFVESLSCVLSWRSSK